MRTRWQAPTLGMVLTWWLVGLMLDARSAGSNEVDGVPWPADPAALPGVCPAAGPDG